MTVMKEREPLNFATTSRAPPVGRPSATFRGGDFSTGGMGNFQAALTLAAIIEMNLKLAVERDPEVLLPASATWHGNHTRELCKRRHPG